MRVVLSPELSILKKLSGNKFSIFKLGVNAFDRDVGFDNMGNQIFVVDIMMFLPSSWWLEGVCDGAQFDY